MKSLKDCKVSKFFLMLCHKLIYDLAMFNSMNGKHEMNKCILKVFLGLSILKTGTTRMGLS